MCEGAPDTAMVHKDNDASPPQRGNTSAKSVSSGSGSGSSSSSSRGGFGSKEEDDGGGSSSSSDSESKYSDRWVTFGKIIY